jgi:hypothetical protein
VVSISSSKSSSVKTYLSYFMCFLSIRHTIDSIQIFPNIFHFTNGFGRRVHYSFFRPNDHPFFFFSPSALPCEPNNFFFAVLSSLSSTRGEIGLDGGCCCCGNAGGALAGGLGRSFAERSEKPLSCSNQLSMVADFRKTTTTTKHQTNKPAPLAR